MNFLSILIIIFAGNRLVTISFYAIILLVAGKAP